MVPESGLGVERLDPVADRRWQDLIDASPAASVFHHPAWLRLLRESYRYGLHALCTVDADGRAVAGLPLAEVRSVLTGRRLVSLPFTDLCGPVHTTGADSHAEGMLLAAVAGERAAVGVDLEIRDAVPDVAGALVVERFLHHQLDLSPGAAALERHRVRSEIRRGAAKGRREGVTVKRSVDRAALQAFFGLHLRTRRRQGMPTQPKGFILGLESLFAQGLGFVLTAHVARRPIAAAVFLAFNGRLVYKYGASDERFLALRPNNLLFMEAIRWGCEHGMGVLDFGRTDLDHAGLARFKRAWGADERRLSYTYLASRLPSEDPPGTARRMLSAAIRRGPLAVTRGVGAVLYRHAG